MQSVQGFYFHSHWCMSPKKSTRFIHVKSVKCESLSRVQLCNSMTVACQAPLSMELSRQEYWSGLPFPSPGDLPDPGIEPGSPALQADSLLSEPPGKPRFIGAAAAAKSLQSCLTMCNPIDSSPPGSTIRGILQARTLEWVAISFSRRSSWPRDWTPGSCITGRLFTIWVTRETQVYSWGKSLV